MTTYTLTINTDELGLGVIDGGKVVVTRKRATAADQYPPVSALYEITTATNGSGIATAAIKADDSSTYHACRVWDADGALVFQVSFAMPPEASDLHSLSEAVIGASNIQFQDEGSNRGTPSTVRTVNFTGNAVSAAFASETLTVTITKPTTAAEVSADPAGTASTAISTHVGDSDPHGDRAYADSLVTGLWDDRGNFDASGNAYPSSGGSGTAGAVKKGDIWTVSVAGTLPTAQVVEAGDTVRALVDAPGQTQANWAIQQNNIGYTPENSANKSTDVTMAASSDTLYPSQKAAKTYIDAATAAITQTGAIATALFINRLDHFIGDEDSACFTLTSFTNPATLSSTEIGTISGASTWRGAAKHAVSTSSGQRRFNFAGGYTSSVAGSGGANIDWAAGDKYQFIWRGAISAVPDGSNQFCVTFGFSTLATSNGYNASTSAGYSHAMIWADETSGFWKCYSRSATSATEESTTTGVAVSALADTTTHVVVAPTGNVEFYINNTLVATHSSGGKIQDGDKLIPVLTWNNKASIAATRYLYSDCVGYLLAFTSQTAGLAWR